MEAELKPTDITRRTFGAYLAGSAVDLSSLVQSQSSTSAARVPTPMSADTITYLMADTADRSDSLKVKREGSSDVKRFWVEQWRDPSQFFEWKLQVPEAGEYDATFMVSAPPGTRIAAKWPGDRAIFETTWKSKGSGGYDWDRIALPQRLAFKQGHNSIRVQLETPAQQARFGAALKSIEILNVKERSAMQARIKAFRSDATWLGRAKFGFMCQCGEWAYPPHGPHKHWPAMIDQFDIPRLVEMVASTGAGYVIWSATWATYFFPAPISAIDRILPGRTSKRDFVGELAKALRNMDMRLILYYHAGHDLTPANGSWWSHNWVSQNDKTSFFNNWESIITEVGERYGDRLAGWMFDDDLLYYPAPYERLGKAAKAGSKSRIISYNPWIQARGTDFQDFQFGEGFLGDDRLPVGGNGIWPLGPQKGLEVHGNFQLDAPDWGIHQSDTVIRAPRFQSEKAIQLAMTAASRNEALSWNLLMYDDGTVSPASLDLLCKIGAVVRAKYSKETLG